MSWLSPVHRSHIGASHQRRGEVCQDASLTGQCISHDGQSIQIMAVADGHGGSRYWLSHIGSRIACEVALEQARLHLIHTSIGTAIPSKETTARLSKWLVYTLPEKILNSWRNAVREDWNQRINLSENQQESFSTSTYGSTLAVVIATSHWWGCTGIGDWDLVRIELNTTNEAFKAEIINSEDDENIQGEATLSLCNENPLKHFAKRSFFKSIYQHEAPFTLFLSTDGIRKSCSTDSDFLSLAYYLMTEIPREKVGGNCSVLDKGLQRITDEGSGDDVSVAIIVRSNLVIQLQTLESNPSKKINIDPQQHEDIDTETRPRIKDALKVWNYRLVAIGLAMLIIMTWAGWSLWSAHSQRLKAENERDKQRLKAENEREEMVVKAKSTAKQLCENPKTIKGALSSRKSMFKQLKQVEDPTERMQFAKQDGLNALISIYQPDQSDHDQYSKKIDLCEDLKEELEFNWQQQQIQNTTYR